MYIISQLKLAGDTGSALLLLDKDLGQKDSGTIDPFTDSDTIFNLNPGLTTMHCM